MTQDRRKYIVGADNETRDTMRTSMARETALYLARMYKQTIWPRPLELTFEVDGVEIVISAKEIKQGITKE